MPASHTRIETHRRVARKAHRVYAVLHVPCLDGGEPLLLEFLEQCAEVLGAFRRYLKPEQGNVRAEDCSRRAFRTRVDR